MMTHKLVCTIPDFPHTYEIEIHPGLLHNSQKLIQQLTSFGSSTRFAIITDDKILSLYGNPLYQMLVKANLETFLFSFPQGEPHKTRATKEHLEDQMFEKGLGRDTCVIALGGGVVTDLAGYIAATYCRGVPLIMIPTSLLGMVDASIGGKTGVNVPFGKNMLGCIYQPKKIWIDPHTTLHSLPINELRNGIVEMIKHGVIADHDYFEYLEAHPDQLLRLDSPVMEQAIFESCRIKKEIVEQDEKEKGKRHLLNFGHTVGHALESVTHYSISHGEAIAIGLLVESHLAVQLGHLPSHSFDRIHRILLKYGLPLRVPNHLSLQAILDAMILDKKSLKGRPRFVIINAIGSALGYDSHYCMHVEENIIKKALGCVLKFIIA